jgi:plasmid maintenance system killer protein
MQVRFCSDRDKKFFESRTELTRRFGPEAAKKFKRCLDDLDAASSMEDMRNLPGKWEELKADRAGQFSARLAGGLRLIAKPSEQPPPSKPDGGLDWPAIDSVTVIEVVDYHD